MLLPWVLCIILAVALIVAIIKNILLKKSMVEILTDFERIVGEDTNIQISISSNDKTAKNLARAINLQLSELRKIKQQCSNGDRELKEAVTNISHDLRTPLTAICGYLDLLEKQQHSEDTERYIAQIRNRSEALKQLTEELLRYSIVVSTESELKLEDVLVNRVLEESIAGYYGALKGKNITPTVIITNKKIVRLLDKTALSRIFGNILSNVVKYSDGDLEVVLDDDGSIVFSNTSLVLDEVQVGKLFNRFYTVSDARTSTGLGLSIARTLVEQMNGEISASYINSRLVISIWFKLKIPENFN